jgi:enoyl-CoA hydratase/carnithine racemase
MVEGSTSWPEQQTADVSPRPEEGTIELAFANGVARLTISRPRQLNSLTGAMVGQLADIVGEITVRRDVRVVVLRGAGERAFCCGADIADLSRSTHRGERFGDGLSVLDRVEVPIIAAIRGYCIGGGMTLALMADLRIASDDSSFAIPAVQLSAPYPLEYVERIVRAVGLAAATSLLLTGARIDARRAADLGIVGDVVPAEDLDEAVDRSAHAIASSAPLAVRAMKACLRAASSREVATDRARCDDLVRAVRTSADFDEGTRAFAERRSPRFVGA